MEENRDLSQREKERVREFSKTGAEKRSTETPDKKSKKGDDTLDQHRAEMDGNVGEFETEHTYPIDESGVAGADQDKDVGTSSAGAGLGGNKGTGTRNKKDFT